MASLRRPAALRRDDLDRLLIVGGIVWLSFGVGLVGLLLAAIAAPALWRDVALARPILLVAALVVAGAAVALGQGPPAVVGTNVVAAVAVAVGASRVRIPASGPPRATQRPDRGRLDLDEEQPTDAAPPPTSHDPADDPTLLRFMDRVSHLDPEETRALGGAWQAVDQAARDRAWTRVRAELRSTHRERLMRAVAEEIERWGRAQGGSPWTWEFGTMTDVDRSDIRRAAMAPLLDAAASIVLRDRLAHGDHDVLAGPWEAIVSASPELS